ncbi:MAG: EAL domain-containing protein [Frankiaceae bacterium]|nr:EAL domain-containing protein [Frankiaceae bacterium]MBV9369256.1 EAL domain-containing protein [Frankiales bacterium]
MTDEPTRVVLVEDDPGHASLLAETLAELGGYRVIWVDTVAGAVERLRQEQIDAVLMDLGLPDATGLEALDTVLGESGGAPVVVVTGRSEEELGLVAVARGAEDYLQKDRADARTLHQTLSYAVQRTRARTLLRKTVTDAEVVLAAVADGIVVKDAHNRIVFANPAAGRIFGVPPEMMLGQPADAPEFRSCHLDGRPYAAGDLPSSRVLATGESVTRAVVGMTRGDGQQIWVELNAHPLVGPAPDQDVFGVVTAIRDVSERLAAEEANRFQAALLAAVGQAVMATDPMGTVLYWNRAAEELYGWTAEEAVGRSVLELTPSTQTAESAAEIMRLLAAGQSWTGDFVVRNKNGREFPALVTDTPVLGPDGELQAIIGVSTDITERKRAEDEMRWYSAVIESTGDAVFGVSLAGEITNWNRAAEQLYGYTADEAVGRHKSMLAPVNRHDEVASVLSAAVRGETTHGLDVVRRHKGGALIDVSLTVSPVHDEAGRVVACSVIARDISDRLAMQREIEHKALHDSLTGLPNRALLSDRLHQALARASRHDAPVSVLFLDLDHFKTINDGAGHSVGDAVLAEVARRLANAVRPSDTVARLGGDEFAVICEGADAEAAGQVAERILAALAEPVAVDDRTLYVSVSVGVAAAPPLDAEELLSHADAAMYDAKARGRSRVRVFDSAMAASAHEQLELSNDLRQALEHDELEVHYQPIIDLECGELVGVEALCRWQHPRLGWVAPDRFVTLAEENGLVATLDRWMLNRATRDARTLIERDVLGASARVSVNISARNVGDATMEAAVREATAAAGIPFTRLALEVTETGVMADPDNACRVLDSLRDLGVRIQLDDFGTGYSSLTYLRRLPVSTLKIDRSFVRDMLDEPDALAIAVSIVDLARSVHLQTIAEGIETAEQLTTLRRIGCWAGQGYLWSPAVPVDELVELVTVDSSRLLSVAGITPTRRRRPRFPQPRAEHGLSRLMQLHHSGASLTTIAAALNTQGFRTPAGTRWHAVTVARTISEIVHPELKVVPGA